MFPLWLDHERICEGNSQLDLQTYESVINWSNAFLSMDSEPIQTILNLNEASANELLFSNSSNFSLALQSIQNEIHSHYNCPNLTELTEFSRKCDSEYLARIQWANGNITTNLPESINQENATESIKSWVPLFNWGSEPVEFAISCKDDPFFKVQNPEIFASGNDQGILYREGMMQFLVRVFDEESIEGLQRDFGVNASSVSCIQHYFFDFLHKQTGFPHLFASYKMQDLVENNVSSSFYTELVREDFIENSFWMVLGRSRLACRFWKGETTWSRRTSLFWTLERPWTRQNPWWLIGACRTLRVWGMFTKSTMTASSGSTIWNGTRRSMSKRSSSPIPTRPSKYSRLLLSFLCGREQIKGTDGFGFIPQSHKSQNNFLLNSELNRIIEYVYYDKYYENQLNFHVYRVNLSSLQSRDSLLENSTNLTQTRPLPLIATPSYFAHTGINDSWCRVEVNTIPIQNLQNDSKTNHLTFTVEKYSGRTVSLNIPLQYSVYMRPGIIYKKYLPPNHTGGWFIPLVVSTDRIEYTSDQVHIPFLSDLQEESKGKLLRGKDQNEFRWKWKLFEESRSLPNRRPDGLPVVPCDCFDAFNRRACSDQNSRGFEERRRTRKRCLGSRWKENEKGHSVALFKLTSYLIS